MFFIMTPFAPVNRLSNYLTGKSILYGRFNWINYPQTCNYTKRSAAARLGLDKPKRPLTPFCKFMTQMRPALLVKKPNMSFKETSAWVSKHWQELDIQTKDQMKKSYEADLKKYREKKAIYESSLTDQQKQDIKKMEEKMAADRRKRKLRAVMKELGCPKQPMSSYFLYAQSRGDSKHFKNVTEYHLKVKEGWMKLSNTEKDKFKKQAESLMAKYLKDLEQWEMKMISLGREVLVRPKTLKEKKRNSKIKKQKQLGFSDKDIDSSTASIKDIDKTTNKYPVDPVTSVNHLNKKSDNNVKLNQTASIENDQRESKNFFYQKSNLVYVLVTMNYFDIFL